MNFTRFTSPLLVAALLAVSPLIAQSCAGVERHGSMPGGARVEGALRVPAGCQGLLTIRGDQQAPIEVLLLDACGRVLAQQITDSERGAAQLQIPAENEGARIVLRNLGEGSTSYVVQIW